MEEKDKEYEKMLFFAEDNFNAALKSLENGNIISSAFLLEESTEKILKVYLMSKGEQMEGHGLTRLLKRCSELDKSFNAFKDKIKDVDAYRETARYPGDYSIPSKDEVEKAINVVKELFELVKEKI